ncbi:hypothetical protein [Atlantibacter hermannii]|nr:hypothetical protein [Atlantibacter hermannii]
MTDWSLRPAPQPDMIKRSLNLAGMALTATFCNTFIPYRRVTS